MSKEHTVVEASGSIRASRKTIGSYYTKIRKCMSKAVANFYNENQLGGENTIVELDETLLGKKRKYHRGSATKQVWVLGLIERNSGRILTVPVPNRRRETLQ